MYNFGFQEYAANPTQNWKAKDVAVYLVTSLAAKAQTMKVVASLSLLTVLSFLSIFLLSKMKRFFFFLYSMALHKRVPLSTLQISTKHIFSLTFRILTVKCLFSIIWSHCFIENWINTIYFLCIYLSMYFLYDGYIDNRSMGYCMLSLKKKSWIIFISVTATPILKADAIKYLMIFRNQVSCLQCCMWFQKVSSGN